MLGHRKILAILLCLIYIQLCPAWSMAQAEMDRRVSLYVEDTLLRDALQTIADQADLRFIYADDLLEETRITLQFDSLSVDQALNQLLDQTPLTFRRLQNNHIVLMQRTRQSLLRGKVIDKETRKPVIGASVFLANTTIGTLTGEDGSYRIRQVPPGAYNMVISHIGYELRAIPVQLLQPDTLRFYSRLKARVLNTSETIEVTADRPNVERVTVDTGKWQKSLKKFTTEFIGRSDYAKTCRILNPEVLRFYYEDKNKVFSATADSLLYIENHAFGYRMAIILNMFESTKSSINYSIIPHFTFMTPRDMNEQIKWIKNRRESYTGSLKHFLSALARGRFEKEYFRVWNILDPTFITRRSSSNVFSQSDALSTARTQQSTKSPWSGNIGWQNQIKWDLKTTQLSQDISPVLPVQSNQNAIISPDTLGLQRIRFDHYIAVEFGSKQSILKLNRASTLVDSLGHLYIPFSFKTYGAWGNEAIGDMLPADYHPIH